MVRAVHYLNQFFAGLGGEDKAETPPTRLEGPVGPGRGLAGELAGVEIVATVGSEVTYTVGIPVRSISFASTAPQRVPVPQVPERRTAPTPALRSSSAISRPKRVAVTTGVPLPVVV